MTPLRSAAICKAKDDLTMVKYKRKCVNYTKEHLQAHSVHESKFAYGKQPVRGAPPLETWYVL